MADEQGEPWMRLLLLEDQRRLMLEANHEWYRATGLDRAVFTGRQLRAITLLIADERSRAMFALRGER